MQSGKTFPFTLPRTGVKIQNTFDHDKYKQHLADVKSDLVIGRRSHGWYMQHYKECIVAQRYEKAAAITDVLAEYKYLTADTHQHIPTLHST